MGWFFIFLIAFSSLAFADLSAIEREKDPFKLLRSSSSASPEELKKAYRKLVLEYHPDRHPGPERARYTEALKKINSAFAIASDPAKRKEFEVGAIDLWGNPISRAYSSASPKANPNEAYQTSRGFREQVDELNEFYQSMRNSDYWTLARKHPDLLSELVKTSKPKNRFGSLGVDLFILAGEKRRSYYDDEIDHFLKVVVKANFEKGKSISKESFLGEALREISSDFIKTGGFQARSRVYLESFIYVANLLERVGTPGARAALEREAIFLEKRKAKTGYSPEGSMSYLLRENVSKIDRKIGKDSGLKATLRTAAFSCEAFFRNFGVKR